MVRIGHPYFRCLADCLLLLESFERGEVAFPFHHKINGNFLETLGTFQRSAESKERYLQAKRAWLGMVEDHTSCCRRLTCSDTEDSRGTYRCINKWCLQASLLPQAILLPPT